MYQKSKNHIMLGNKISEFILNCYIWVLRCFGLLPVGIEKFEMCFSVSMTIFQFGLITYLTVMPVVYGRHLLIKANFWFYVATSWHISESPIPLI